MIGISSSLRPAPVATGAGRTADSEADIRATREAAVRLEASFLSEMLRAAGFGECGGEFSGGAGAEQFASFQREAVALRMAKAGGVGLADQFFAAMTGARHER